MNLIFILYELLTVLLPTLLLYFVLKAISLRKNPQAQRTSFFGVLLFACYICAVFYVTGAGTLADLFRFGFEWHPSRVNLLPFSDGYNIESFLNLIMLLPLGFLVPLIWPESASWARTVAAGFFFSLFIEMSQLLNARATDVDDLILNTLGALIGYTIYKAIFGGKEKKIFADQRGKYEPFLYLVVMFIGHFLFFDGFALAKVLYGF